MYDMPVVIGKAGEPTEVVAMKTETILQKWVDVFVPGDWGEDDQKGRMNLLTPERVKAAAGDAAAA